MKGELLKRKEEAVYYISFSILGEVVYCISLPFNEIRLRDSYLYFILCILFLSISPLISLVHLLYFI